MVERGSASVETTQVSQPFSLSAHGPLLQLNGGAYALVSGELNGTAKIKISSHHELREREFFVGPGKVAIAFGGPEEWADDFHIHYTPMTATGGRLNAKVYCGRVLKPSDESFYNDLHRRR